MNRWIVTAVVTFGLTPCVYAEVRTWTDSTGKFKTEAEFVKFEDDQVTLKKGDKTVVLPFDRLSDEDQAFVEDLLDELEDDAATRDQPRPRAQPAETAEPTATVDPATTAKTDRPRVPNNVINSVRGAVYRDQTLKNMRQIGLAILNYESTKGRYPTNAIMSRDRKPLLSWRVAILPMLDEQVLYRQFKLDEPWDSEHNKPLIERMPSIYQSPGSSLVDGYTNYLAVAGPDTIITNGNKANRMRNIRDGTSKTLMVVEADDRFGTAWTRPLDYAWDPDRPLQGLGGIWPSQFFGVFGDGHVSRVSTALERTTINALVTVNGGEPITEEF